MLRTAAIRGAHSVILLNNGTVKGTGANEDGQLGDGTKTTRYTPVIITVN